MPICLRCNEGNLPNVAKKAIVRCPSCGTLMYVEPLGSLKGDRGKVREHRACACLLPGCIGIRLLFEVCGGRRDGLKQWICSRLVDLDVGGSGNSKIS